MRFLAYVLCCSVLSACFTSNCFALDDDQLSPQEIEPLPDGVDCHTYFQGTFLKCEICEDCVYVRDGEVYYVRNCVPALGGIWCLGLKKAQNLQ